MSGRKRNLLVTGSSGFTGRNLVRALLAQGDKVFGLDKVPTEGEFLSSCTDFTFTECDLTCRDSVQKAFQNIEDIDAVFHVAAVQPEGSKMDTMEYLKPNLIGAVNLLEVSTSTDIKYFIISSSFSVYGKPEYLPVDENHSCHPVNVYGLSKLQAELLFEFYTRKSNLNTVILRYDGVYGHGQTVSGYIQYLVNSFLKNEDVVLFNQGAQKRDYVYIGDVVQANLKALEHIHDIKYDVFNIAGGEPKTALDIARITKEVCASKSKLELSEEGNPLLSYDTYMSINKAREMLNYDPQPLRTNIASWLWARS